MNEMTEKAKVRVRVSEHAIKQFKNRIVLNDLFEREQIIGQIKNLFSEAHYVSDNNNGILFRHNDLMIEFIVKNGCIITLFPITKKGA